MKEKESTSFLNADIGAGVQSNLEMKLPLHTPLTVNHNSHLQKVHLTFQKENKT